jgi:hypothetical protein
MKLYGKNEIKSSVKTRAALELRRLVEKQVKKELAKRRKKMARRLVVMGATFTVGCLLYAFSDKIVDLAGDWIFESAVNGKKQRTLISRDKIKFKR